jgi:hypothetical protein
MIRRIQMGYEEGTVLAYNGALWLFAGYSIDNSLNKTIILHGLHGVVVEAAQSEVHYIISPSEVDHDELNNTID